MLREKGTQHVDGNGVPVGLAVDGANRVDFNLARATLEGMPVERPDVARTAKQHASLDKGYNSAEIDALTEEFGFTAHTARRGEPTRKVKR